MYLSSTFVTSKSGGLSDPHSRWRPSAGHPSLLANVRRVIDTPLAIGTDLHSNPGHNQLDCVFPTFAALLRLRAAADAAATSSPAAAAAARALSNSSSSPSNSPATAFAFLLFGGSYHRGTRERAFATNVGGHHAIDLKELRAACEGAGCLVRTGQEYSTHITLRILSTCSSASNPPFVPSKH